MALRKIGECIRDCQRPVSSQLELNVLAVEADDQDITGYGDVYWWQRVVGERTEAADRRFSN